MGSAEMSDVEKREAFVEEAIKELKKRPELRKHLSEEEKKATEQDAATTAAGLRITPEDVAKILCFDFPVLGSEECSVLATAIRDETWRLKQRLSYRLVRGVKQLPASQGAADLAGAIGVSAVKALLEMPRSHVVRFASKPFYGDDDLAEMRAKSKKKDEPPPPPKKGIDYSKWDNLDSDDEAEAADPVPKPVVADGVDVSATLPIENAKDGLQFFLECTALADAAALFPLKEGWTALLEEVKAVALALRGDDSLEGGWLLAKDEDGRLKQEYERYVFLARDVCLSCPQRGPRQLAADLLVDLALSPGGGARSAKDGGVAIVAIATLSPAAAAATKEQVVAQESKDEAKEEEVAPVPAAPDRAEAVIVFRETARRVLPAVAELVRAVAHDRGDGDESLVGAALAILETANGVSTAADATATTTTTDEDQPEGTKQQPPVAHFTTHFEVTQGASPNVLIDTGLLSGLCALAPRLKAESSAADGVHRADEAEVRLHRLLLACAAQSPTKIGDFLSRATPLLEVIYDAAFVDRRPTEAALWAVRLGAVQASLKTRNDPRITDLLQRSLHDNQAELPRLRIATHVLAHLNATRSATANWLTTSTYGNAYFLRLRDTVLTAKAPTTPRTPSALPKDDDDHVPEEDQPDAKLKLRAAARDKILTQLRRQLKLLPLSEDSNGTSTPRNVRGKLD